MARNICRLCFEEKASSIGIFSSKGFLLGVASAIRMHFLDEVKKHINDIMQNARVRIALALHDFLVF